MSGSLPSHHPASGPPPVLGVYYRSWPQPDGGLRIEFLSDGADELLEASADEIAAMLRDRTLPITGVDPAAFYAASAASAAAHAPWAYDFGFIGPKTGRERWVRAQDFPRRTADGVPYFEGVIVDITALKRAEQEARRMYRTFAAHLENAPLAVIEWDAEMRVVKWSGRAGAIFGWTAGEIVGKRRDDWRFVHEDDAERIRAAAESLAAANEPRNFIRNRNYHKSGRVLHCEWHNSILTDDAGKVVSVLSLVQDVTEREEARIEAACSEERLRMALAFAGMLSWDFDQTRNRAYYSADYAEFYGMPPETGPRSPALSGLGEHLFVIHPDDRPAVVREVEAALAAGDELRTEFRGVLPAPDGGPRWFVSRGRVIRGPAGTPDRVLGVTADITARKRAEDARNNLEREVHDARRRESLGVLAGGIAHDLNNILTVVLGYTQLLRADDGLTHAGRPALVEIERACHRAADLCRQMTAFAGTGRVMTEHLDLCEVIREAADALTAAAHPAALRFDLPDPSPVAFADPFQVRQVLLNLVRNAGESGGREVRLTAETAAITADSPPDGFAPRPRPGRYAALVVSDDGRGMDEKTRSAVFDPFFTTKGVGRGLGMAAVFGIIRSHRGAIRVDSTPGRGTAVRVLLPASPPLKRPLSPTPLRISEPSPARPARGSAGVALVADDEPNIRELTAAVLEDAGYSVRAAKDGRQALDLFRQEPAAVRLAVIDVVMPELSGTDLVREMRAARPDLPIVLMTGYTARQLPNDVTARPNTAVLTKPFRLEQLVAAVRRAVPTTSSTPPV